MERKPHQDQCAKFRSGASHNRFRRLHSSTEYYSQHLRTSTNSCVPSFQSNLNFASNSSSRIYRAHQQRRSQNDAVGSRLLVLPPSQSPLYFSPKESSYPIILGAEFPVQHKPNNAPRDLSLIQYHHQQQLCDDSFRSRISQQQSEYYSPQFNVRAGGLHFGGVIAQPSLSTEKTSPLPWFHGNQDHFSVANSSSNSGHLHPAAAFNSISVQKFNRNGFNNQHLNSFRASPFFRSPTLSSHPEYTTNLTSYRNNNNGKKTGSIEYLRLLRHVNNGEPVRPARLEMLLDMPPVSLEVQKKHAWNDEDRSWNMFLNESDSRIVHRHPVAMATDAVRGLVGYKKGLHVWEIEWPQLQRGSHAMVGVSTGDTLLYGDGYQPLVGNTENSWGWDLVRNRLYHNMKTEVPTLNLEGRVNRQEFDHLGEDYKHQFSRDPNFVVSKTFAVVLDMDEGTLAFMANGQYLGIAFRGLKGKTLFPMVSAVWGNCAITMRYINGTDLTSPASLKDLARRMVRQNLSHNRSHLMETVHKLQIPRSLYSYLAYQVTGHNKTWKPIL